MKSLLSLGSFRNARVKKRSYPKGRAVSCQCHANGDEWRQMVTKGEKRR